jgi:hypothetical protein
MRLGRLVVAPALREPLLGTIEDTAAAVSVIDQLALADLIVRAATTTGTSGGSGSSTGGPVRSSPHAWRR